MVFFILFFFLIFNPSAHAEDTPSPPLILVPYNNETTRALLLDALKDRDRVQRLRALKTLRDAHDPRNAEALAAMEEDPVEAIRKEVHSDRLIALREAPSEIFKPRPVVPESQWTLSHRDPRIRQKARILQLESNPAYTIDFSPMLEEPDDFVRRSVTDSILKMRGSASLPVWQKLLNSQDPLLRVEAAFALGKLNSKTDESHLITLLQDHHERLRATAAEALEIVGGEATRNALPAILANSDTSTRIVLLQLASKIRALPALSIAQQWAANIHLPLTLRLPSIDLLAAIPAPSSIPVLIEILKNVKCLTYAQREHAARALGILGATSSLPDLKHQLLDRVIPNPGAPPDFDLPDVRIACLRSIEQLQDVHFIQSLPSNPSILECPVELRQELAATLSRLTGKSYDYRRDVLLQTPFILSLLPDEYPSEETSMMQKPPVFPIQP